MTKKQFLFWLTQTVLVTILGGLRFVERDSGGDSQIRSMIAIFVYDHRLFISISLVFVIEVLAGWKELISTRKKAKEIRQKIMDAMLEELFSRDKNNYRISIFRRATIFRRLRIYIKQMIDYVMCRQKGEAPEFF